MIIVILVGNVKDILFPNNSIISIEHHKLKIFTLFHFISPKLRFA